MPGNALVSVYDKTGLNELARTFLKHHVEMMGSGGTAEAIRALRIKVTEVSEYTGVKEMPGGLVKTLHPKVHAAILGDWSDPVQREYLEATGVKPLDFVVVNLYPFSKVVKSEPENLGRAIDNIDIGGVALIRAAGKGAFLNHRVVPITNPSQYASVIEQMETTGHVGSGLRQILAREAFAVTAEYDTTIRDYLEEHAQ